MVTWSVELSEYDVQFEPRTTIKAQALADFLIKSTSPDDEPIELHSSDTLTPTKEQNKKAMTLPAYPTPDHEDPEFASWWFLKVDGSSSETGSGAGVVLSSPNGTVTEQSIAFEFTATNNEAKYEALIAGLRAALAVKIESLYILADSQLIVHQVNGKYAAKDKRMAQYLKIVKDLLAQLKNFRVAQVPRALNARADALSKLASTSSLSGPVSIYTDTLKYPSITESPSDVMQTDTVPRPCWMDPII